MISPTNVIMQIKSNSCYFTTITVGAAAAYLGATATFQCAAATYLGAATAYLAHSENTAKLS